MVEREMTTKKSLLILGGLIIFTTATLLLPARYVGIKKQTEKPLILKSSSELAELRGDKDNNGTPDWKDVLNNEMSTTTKQVVSSVIVDEATKKRLADPNNITASFSKNLYTAIAYANQKGDLTDEEKDAIATGLLEQENSKIAFTNYEVTDLTLTKNETDASRKEYVNTLGVLYKKTGASTMSVDDTMAIQAYMTSKDPSLLQTFIIKKNSISTIISELLKMSVPYSAAPYHLLLINSLSRYKTTLENLSTIEDDPMRATIAFNSYIPTVKAIRSALISLQSYITIENITFTKNDSGYILIQGATIK